MVDSKLEYRQNAIVRDTRTLGQRVADALSDPTWAGVILMTAGIATIFFIEIGMLSDVLVLIGWGYIRWYRWMADRRRLPLRMPQHAKRRDPGFPDPGTGKPRTAAGIMYVGNDRDTNEEIWVSNDDARQHILYLGTTGAGKTEGQKALVSNALTWGSGFIYVDGKADTKLWADIYAMVRRFGRDDDIRILNYITGNSDKAALSNTLNPFAFGSARAVIELIVSLMPEAGSDPMWQERAIGLVNAVVPVLVWLRDNKGLLLDAGTIRAAFPLPEVIKLSRRPDIPVHVRKPMNDYLQDLPGYTSDAFDDNGEAAPPPPGKQAPDLSTVREQHNFLTMQLTRALGALNDDYGYIFRTQLAEIDMRDVVLNRRILVVLLPALEVSPPSLANLGKIIVANLKGMMAATLGSAVEGEWEEAIDNKPTNSPSPFMGLFDEAGYYIVEGFGVMFAQARSLGFSLTVGAQDVAALKKRIAEEADSVIGNCNLQLWGRLTDPMGTRDLFEKSVGEVMMAEVAGYSATVGNMGPNYTDRLDATMQRRVRAEWLDVRGQTEGKVHLTFLDRLIKANMYYAPIKKVKWLRVGRFLQVGAHAAPPEAQALSKEVAALCGKLRDPNWAAVLAAPKAETPLELKTVMGAFVSASKSGMTALQSACVAVASLEEPLADKAERLRAALAGEPAAAPPASAASPMPVPVAATAAAPTSSPPLPVPASAATDDALEQGAALPIEEAAGDLDQQEIDASALLDAAVAEVGAPVATERSYAQRLADILVQTLCAASSALPGRAGGGSPSLPPVFDAAADQVLSSGLEKVELAAGADVEEARANATEVMQDLAKSNHYPGEPVPEPADPEHLLKLLENIKHAVSVYQPGKRTS